MPVISPLNQGDIFILLVKTTCLQECSCFFFIFVYIFLGFVCIAGPQAQTQLFSQHRAAGFLWERQINISSVKEINAIKC